MKNVIFLMSAMLVLTLNSFSQPQTNEDPYKSFLKAKLNDGHKVDTLSKISYSKADNKLSLSSGDYLIKAKNQFFGGIVLGMVSGGFLYFGSSQYKVTTNQIHGKLTITTTGKGIRDACYVGAGVCGFIGFICELSGIGNIGKAGVSLNENGVGVK